MTHPKIRVRDLPPHTRRLALLLYQLESVTLSLWEVLTDLTAVELAARAAMPATEAKEEGQ